MKHGMGCPYITEQNMRFLQGFSLPDCRISIASLIHTAGRQFHLNGTNCQSKRATGPYRFLRKCLSPCYGMIAACLQKRQLLLLSEKKKKPSGQPKRVSFPLTYFRAWSSSKPGPNPTALHRADPLSICYAIWHHVFSDGPMRTFIKGLTRQWDSSPTFGVQFSSVQLLSHVQLFATPWIAARQASLSITKSWSSPKPTPLSWWCHPAISSSVVPYSSCPQSLPASGSFPMSTYT